MTGWRLGYVAAPEEHGRMAAFLVSPANGCMSGRAFIFDGAMTASY